MDDDLHSRIPDVVDRRSFLGGVVACSLPTISGCSSEDSTGDQFDGGSGNGSTATRNDTPPDEPDGTTPVYPPSYDGLFQIPFQHGVSDHDWNPLRVDMPEIRRGVYAQFTQYLVGQDRFYPHLVEDWEHDEGEMILDLSADFTWSRSGDPVTAADLALQLDILDAADHIGARFVADAVPLSTHRLRIVTEGYLNTDLLEYTVLPLLADIPRRQWEDTEWEENPRGVGISEPETSGPLYVGDRYEDRSLSLRVRGRSGEGIERHHLEDQYNWEGYRGRYTNGSNPPLDRLSAWGSDGSVSTHSGNGEIETARERYRIIEIPGSYGQCLWFNHEKDPWTDRRMRQAVLYSVDTAAIIEAELGSTYLPNSVPSGITAQTEKIWFGSERPELSSYETDVETASELVDEAGYSIGDIDLHIGRFLRSTMSDVSERIASQLRDAGWSVTIVEHENDGLYESLFPENDDDDADLRPFRLRPVYGPPPNRAVNFHPYFTIEYVLRGDYRRDGHIAGYDPGSVPLDGESVDPLELLGRLARTTPRDEQLTLVRRLSRLINTDAPFVPVYGSQWFSAIDTSEWAVPEESPHLMSFWPQWWLPKVNETLQYAEESGLMKRKWE